MHLQSLRQLRHSALFGWLLLFVVARGLLAPGVMPAFGVQGISVVLCTSQGPQATWPAETGTVLAHGSLDCPFGLSVGMAALPATAVSLPLASSDPESPQATDRPGPIAGAGRAYFARGPPAHT